MRGDVGDTQTRACLAAARHATACDNLTCMYIDGVATWRMVLKRHRQLRQSALVTQW